MNEQEFERTLQNREMRRIPDNWRREILDAARITTAATASANRTGIGWRELLWPCPQVWGGLAAAWVIIGALHIFSPAGGKHIATASSPDLSNDVLAAVTERRLLLADLISPTAKPDPAKPSTPGRRSDRKREQVIA